MTFPASLFLENLQLIPRRAQHEPVISVIVSAGTAKDEDFEITIKSLSQQNLLAIEFLVIDDGFIGTRRQLIDRFWQNDHRVTVLRFPYNRGIPAIGVNQALKMAQGRYIAYQTGAGYYVGQALQLLLDAAETQAHSSIIGHCLTAQLGLNAAKQTVSPSLDSLMHHYALLARTGLADAHVLLKEHWMDDLFERLSDLELPSTLNACTTQLHRPRAKVQIEIFLYPAKNRPRMTQLVSHTIEDLDVLDNSFLSDTDAVDRFYDEIAAPYVARHWQSGKQLHYRALPYTVLRRPLRLLLQGETNSASAEITYGNFARVFPDCVSITSNNSSLVIAEQNYDALVNLRNLEPPSFATHQIFQDASKPIIYAMDDNLLRLAEFPSIKNIPYLPIAIEHVQHYIANADCVITWSAHCAKDVQAFNPRVAVLSTNIERQRLPNNPSPLGADQRLLFSSLSATIKHKADSWQGVIREWTEFFRRHRDKAKLILFYRDANELLLYREWFSGIDYEARPSQSYQDYLETIASSGFHVILVPLTVDSDVLKSKCPIKFLEATSCGAILMTSDVSIYQMLYDGTECLKVSDQPGAWTRALEYGLNLGKAGRQQIWQTARSRIEHEFTTESQYIPFFLTHEIAQLHALAGSRLTAQGKACLLLITRLGSVNSDAIQAWADLLARYHFDAQVIFDNNTVDESLIASRLIQQNAANRIFLVILDQVCSQWAEQCSALDVPIIVVIDDCDAALHNLGNPSRKSADGFICRSISVARRLRESDWQHVWPVDVPQISQNEVEFTVPITRLVPGGPACVSILCNLAIEKKLLLSQLQNALPFLTFVEPNDGDILLILGQHSQAIGAALNGMLNERIVIAAASEDVAELLHNGVNGWFMPRFSLETLIRLVREICSLSSEQQQQIRRNARITAQTRTDVHAILLNLTIILKDVLLNYRSTPLHNDSNTTQHSAEKSPSVCAETFDAATTLANADSLMQSAQYESAATAYRTLVEHVHSEQGYLGLVQALNFQQQPKLALQEALKALIDFPASIPLLFITGLLQLKLNQLTEAETRFRSILAFDDQHIDALYGVACAAMQRKDWSVSLCFWERCIQTAPNSPNRQNWHAAKAYVLSELDQNVEAEQLYRSLLVSNPQHSTAYYGLAKLAEKTEDWQQAITHYQYCLQEFADDARIGHWREALANLYLKTGDLKAAELEFTRLSNDYPDHPVGPNGLYWVDRLRNTS